MVIFICLLVAVFVSWVTFNLSEVKNIGPVRASAMVTLVSILIIYLLEITFQVDLNKYENLMFGATFVGMSSRSVLSRRQLIIAALLYAAVFTYLTPYFSDLGGALGFSAFLAVICTRSLVLKLRVL